ncbi:hypothetical protein Aksp01_17180 [Akkermansia sp. NBRC 115031]|nr:hypothetical protein Aksp01_17180 [Akkermansia sp. NBRC 115031]
MEAVGLGAAFYANELFSPSAFSSQAGNHSASSETGEPEEETTYRIRISEIEAKLGVKKTLKLGEEIISVHIPSDVREGQNVTIPSLVQEGTTYRGVISLQNDPFLKQHAEQGNKEDQYLLGMSYYHGVGIPKSIKKGITWLERAAGQGSVDAQFMMGRICFNGEEMKVPDLEKGLMWFKLALTNSHPEAQKWIDKCQRLLNSSRKDFDSNRKVNEPISEENRDSSFLIAFKGGITCLALLVWVCVGISSGGPGFLSIIPIGGFLAWLWDKSK